MTCLYLELPLPRQYYTDLGHWAWRYIIAMTEAGYVTNYPDGTFRPDKDITRAEAVKLFNSVFDRQPDKDYIDKQVKPTYPDLPKDHWAYYEITEAAAGHEYGYYAEDETEIGDTMFDGGKNSADEKRHSVEVWVRKAGK